MSWLWILIAVGVGLWLFSFLRRDSATGLTTSAELIPTGSTPFVWDPSGDFNCEVVGESHYQQALQLAADLQADNPDAPLLALLTPETNNPHDSHAVSVRLGQHLVGYLPRESARAYRKLLARSGKGLIPVYAHAELTGGFDLADGTKAHIGIMLDLEDLEND
jgi:hypothetical protein